MLFRMWYQRKEYKLRIIAIMKKSNIQLSSKTEWELSHYIQYCSPYYHLFAPYFVRKEQWHTPSKHPTPRFQLMCDYRLLKIDPHNMIIRLQAPWICQMQSKIEDDSIRVVCTSKLSIWPRCYNLLQFSNGCIPITNKSPWCTFPVSYTMQ
jgi:hypothetical protein